MTESKDAQDEPMPIPDAVLRAAFGDDEEDPYIPLSDLAGELGLEVRRIREELWGLGYQPTDVATKDAARTLRIMHGKIPDYPFSHSLAAAGLGLRQEDVAAMRVFLCMPTVNEVKHTTMREWVLIQAELRRRGLINDERATRKAARRDDGTLRIDTAFARNPTPSSQDAPLGAGQAPPTKVTAPKVTARASTDTDVASAKSDSVSRSGVNVAGYLLLDQLGAGGMGTVHLAVDGAGRSVALKLMAPGLLVDSASRTRFDRESRVLRALPPNPHLPRYLGAGIDQGAPYLVMENVPGSALSRIAPLPNHDVLRLAADLAEALAVLHEHHLVHRDVKPGNIIWSVERGACLVDFGLAQLEQETRITATDQVIGSAGYMAPERYSAEPVTAAVDIWSWAAVVYWALSGRGLFGDGSAHVVSMRVIGGLLDNDVMETGAVLGPIVHRLLRRSLSERAIDRPTAAEAHSTLSGA